VGHGQRCAAGSSPRHGRKRNRTLFNRGYEPRGTDCGHSRVRGQPRDGAQHLHRAVGVVPCSAVLLCKPGRNSCGLRRHRDGLKSDRYRRSCAISAAARDRHTRSRKRHTQDPYERRHKTSLRHSRSPQTPWNLFVRTSYVHSALMNDRPRKRVLFLEFSN
jgi:hypothetical protein